MACSASQQDADGIRPYTFNADVKGKKEIHLCIGDVADGNKGDIALVKLQIKRSPKGDTVDYLDWLKRRLDDDKKALAVTPPPRELQRGCAQEAHRGIGTPHRRNSASIRARAHRGPEGARADVLRLSKRCRLPPEAVQFRAEFQLDMQNPDVGIRHDPVGLGSRPSPAT